MVISVGLEGTLVTVSNGTDSKLSSAEDDFVFDDFDGLFLAYLQIAPTIYINAVILLHY